MNDIIRNDLLYILGEVNKIFHTEERITYRANDFVSLSNRCIHNASIFQDADSIQLAVIIYSLSKVIERSEDGVSKKLKEILIDSLDDLKKQNIELYRKDVKNILNEISIINSKLQLYVRHVIEESMLKKGAKIIDHGISLSRTAEILGLSQWELMNYFGKTKISDSYEEDNKRKTKVDMKNRLAYARELFNVNDVSSSE